MKIKNNIALRDFTTFKIGGCARYFVSASSVKDIHDAVTWAHERGVNYVILGGGSNILIDDKGYDGLIIQPHLKHLSIDNGVVQSGASVLLRDLIAEALHAGLVGLEFAAGIPGTVGGAVRGNAGTYGLSISDVLISVTYLHESSFALHTDAAQDCGFEYRHSIFKEHNHIIVACAMKLQTGDVEASRSLIKQRIQIRKSSHPLQPSAGCVFKNVLLTDEVTRTLQHKGVDIGRFIAYKKIPTGFLIEELGLKGKTMGGAQISRQHGNYIINTGTASSADVLTLISLMKQQVRDAYGIQLEEELIIL